MSTLQGTGRSHFAWRGFKESLTCKDLQGLECRSKTHELCVCLDPAPNPLTPIVNPLPPLLNDIPQWGKFNMRVGGVGGG